MQFKKYKFAVVVFLLFSLPFLILSAHFLNSIKDISKKDMLSYMDFRVKTISSEISSILNMEYDVLGIAKDKNFLNMTLEQKKKELARIAENLPQIVNEISIVGQDGKELFSTMKGKKLGNLKDNPIFMNAKTDDFSVGAVNYPNDAPPELIIGAPVIKVKGEKPLYTLMARLSLGYLNEKVAARIKGMSGKISLIDAGGQVIFDSGYNYLFKVGLKVEDQVFRIISRIAREGISSHSGESDFNGVDALVSISNVDSTAWWVYERMDVDKVIDYRLYKWARKVVVIGLIIMLIFSLLITFKLIPYWLMKGEG